MKGPFAMLLIGGGAILLIGLFTGKITFPGAPGGPSQQQLTNAEKAQLKKNAGAKDPNKNGGCDSGYQMFGGICMPNSVLGQI